MASYLEGDAETIKYNRKHAKSAYNDYKKRIKLYENETKVWEQIIRQSKANEK